MKPPSHICPTKCNKYLLIVIFQSILHHTNAIPVQSTSSNNIEPCRTNCIEKQIGNPFEISPEISGGVNHGSKSGESEAPAVSDLEKNGTQVFRSTINTHDIGTYSTICWTKITTLKRHLHDNKTETIEEYAISFESPADIPKDFQSTSTQQDIPADGIQNTKMSIKWPAKFESFAGDVYVMEVKSVQCASGPIYSKTVTHWPGSNRSKFEVRVSPKNSTATPKCVDNSATIANRILPTYLPTPPIESMVDIGTSANPDPTIQSIVNSEMLPTDLLTSATEPGIRGTPIESETKAIDSETRLLPYDLEIPATENDGTSQYNPEDTEHQTLQSEILMYITERPVEIGKPYLGSIDAAKEFLTPDQLNKEPVVDNDMAPRVILPAPVDSTTRFLSIEDNTPVTELDNLNLTNPAISPGDLILPETSTGTRFLSIEDNTPVTELDNLNLTNQAISPGDLNLPETSTGTTNPDIRILESQPSETYPGATSDVPIIRSKTDISKDQNPISIDSITKVIPTDILTAEPTDKDGSLIVMNTAKPEIEIRNMLPKDTTISETYPDINSEIPSKDYTDISQPAKTIQNIIPIVIDGSTPLSIDKATLPTEIIMADITQLPAINRTDSFLGTDAYSRLYPFDELSTSQGSDLSTPYSRTLDNQGMKPSNVDSVLLGNLPSSSESSADESCEEELSAEEEFLPSDELSGQPETDSKYLIVKDVLNMSPTETRYLFVRDQTTTASPLPRINAKNEVQNQDTDKVLLVGEHGPSSESSDSLSSFVSSKNSDGSEASNSSDGSYDSDESTSEASFESPELQERASDLTNLLNKEGENPNGRSGSPDDMDSSNIPKSLLDEILSTLQGEPGKNMPNSTSDVDMAYINDVIDSLINNPQTTMTKSPDNKDAPLITDRSLTASNLQDIAKTESTIEIENPTVPVPRINFPAVPVKQDNENNKFPYQIEQFTTPNVDPVLTEAVTGRIAPIEIMPYLEGAETTFPPQITERTAQYTDTTLNKIGVDTNVPILPGVTTIVPTTNPIELTAFSERSGNLNILDDEMTTLRNLEDIHLVDPHIEDVKDTVGDEEISSTQEKSTESVSTEGRMLGSSTEPETDVTLIYKILSEMTDNPKTTAIYPNIEEHIVTVSESGDIDSTTGNMQYTPRILNTDSTQENATPMYPNVEEHITTAGSANIESTTELMHSIPQIVSTEIKQENTTPKYPNGEEHISTAGSDGIGPTTGNIPYVPRILSTDSTRENTTPIYPNVEEYTTTAGSDGIGPTAGKMPYVPRILSTDSTQENSTPIYPNDEEHISTAGSDGIGPTTGNMPYVPRILSTDSTRENTTPIYPNVEEYTTTASSDGVESRTVQVHYIPRIISTEITPENTTPINVNAEEHITTPISVGSDSIIENIHYTPQIINTEITQENETPLYRHGEEHITSPLSMDIESTTKNIHYIPRIIITQENTTPKYPNVEDHISNPENDSMETTTEYMHVIPRVLNTEMTQGYTTQAQREFEEHITTPGSDSIDSTTDKVYVPRIFSTEIAQEDTPSIFTIYKTTETNDDPSLVTITINPTIESSDKTSDGEFSRAEGDKEITTVKPDVIEQYEATLTTDLHDTLNNIKTSPETRILPNTGDPYTEGTTTHDSIPGHDSTVNPNYVTTLNDHSTSTPTYSALPDGDSKRTPIEDNYGSTIVNRYLSEEPENTDIPYILSMVTSTSGPNDIKETTGIIQGTTIMSDQYKDPSLPVAPIYPSDYPISGSDVSILPTPRILDGSSIPMSIYGSDKIPTEMTNLDLVAPPDLAAESLQIPSMNKPLDLGTYSYPTFRTIHEHSAAPNEMMGNPNNEYLETSPNGLIGTRTIGDAPLPPIVGMTDGKKVTCYGPSMVILQCPEDMRNVPVYNFPPFNVPGPTPLSTTSPAVIHVNDMDGFVRFLCTKKMHRYLNSKKQGNSPLRRYLQSRLEASEQRRNRRLKDGNSDRATDLKRAIRK